MIKNLHGTAQNNTEVVSVLNLQMKLKSVVLASVEIMEVPLHCLHMYKKSPGFGDIGDVKFMSRQVLNWK